MINNTTISSIQIKSNRNNTYTTDKNKQLSYRRETTLQSESFVAKSVREGQGDSKSQNGRFPSKIAICLKKVCYKVSLCENCKAFISLSIHAKMTGRGRPLLRENLADTDPPPCKTPIFNLFSLLAPQP